MWFKLWMILGSLLTIVGVLGNSIVFYVSTKPKFRNIAIFRYLSVSMINDLLVLFTAWFYIVPDYFKINTERFGCKITQYFGYLFYQYSPFIITIASINIQLNSIFVLS